MSNPETTDPATPSEDLAVSSVQDEPESRPGGIPLYVWVIAAVVLAIPLGLFWGEGATSLEIMPRLILRALTALAAPLVVLAILSAIVTNEIHGRQGALMMVFHLINTLVAMLLGLTLTNLFQPGLGASLAEPGAVVHPLAKKSVTDLLVELVPRSIARRSPRTTWRSSCFRRWHWGSAWSGSAMPSEPGGDIIPAGHRSAHDRLRAAHEGVGHRPKSPIYNLTLCRTKRRTFGAFSLENRGKPAVADRPNCQTVSPRISQFWDDALRFTQFRRSHVIRWSYWPHPRASRGEGRAGCAAPTSHPRLAADQRCRIAKRRASRIKPAGTLYF